MTNTPRILKTATALALALGLAVAFGGCSSSSPTKAPSNSGTGTPATQGAAQKTPAAADGGLGGAVSALSDIKSYKFTMTMKGGSYGDLLGSAPMTGTIVTDPPAADVNMMGMQIREVGGKSYVNLGTTWVPSTDASQSSLADSLSPAKMFSSYLGADTASGYKKAGEEKKNGVDAIHFTASSDLMAQYGSMLGVTGGTWSSDVWVAKDGGYPVSMKLASTGGDSEFLFSIDITNINDPANVITAP